MTFHEQYAIAAAVTLAVELPIVLYVARRARLLHSDARVLVAALVANAATHPALWYVPWTLFPSVLEKPNYPLYLVVGETAVLLVETVVYWRLLVPHRPWLALAMSALANAASYAAGLAVWALIR
ncbi:MAG: hypothetical protein HY905_18065 [Deltaproteobacteria bacterium]|nr:hypothetical protein [Deltaproteobacteria bacterium]